MKIAVASDTPDLAGNVALTFSDAKCLLIVDMENGNICKSAEKRPEDLFNKNFADIIVEEYCESVICGEIEKIPFEILADHGVTRSFGSNLPITDALKRENSLSLITDYIGGTGCGSHIPEN